MSDMRFIMIGLVVITVGFIVLGVVGAQFTEITVQTKEFSECYEYPDDKPPIRIECDEYLQNKNLLFVLVIAIIASGCLSLIKGVRGKWDQDVKPEEMLGPGDHNNDDSKDES